MRLAAAKDVCETWRAIVFALCVFCGLALPLGAAARAADLLGVRLGVTNKDATRIVLDLSDEAEYALSGEDAGKGRIVVQLNGVSAKPGEENPGTGHIASFRVETARNITKVVFDLSRTAKIEEHFVLPPSPGVKKHRLVIDLATANREAFLASLPSRYQDLTEVLKAVTAPTKASGPALANKPVDEDAPPIVVIDAGHGGVDPGAVGPGGVEEKTVTLAAAKQLAEILKARGRYRIVMTRADDSRLDLQQRSRLAREAGADLFISLHADAYKDASLRGGSVYTISDEGRARSAQAAETIGGYHAFDLDLQEFSPDVSEILFDKAQNFTVTNSTRFADILVRHLQGVTPLLRNSHRRGNLFVLLAPDVPAALVELAYISNRKDLANLTSPAWRERTMTAVADAIDAYFDGRKTARHASAAR